MGGDYARAARVFAVTTIGTRCKVGPMNFPTRRSLAACIATAGATSLFLALVLAAPASWAQSPTPLADNLLGMSLTDLKARLPKLQRATPPVRGPRGLRGTRTTKGDFWQGFALENIFFFRNQDVVRIEQRGLARQPETCQSGWEQRLADTLSQRWGPSLSTTNNTGTPDWERATVWVQGELQARLLVGQGNSASTDESNAANATHTFAPCAVLLVLEPYAPQDASSL
jgi:hypothetical protein